MGAAGRRARRGRGLRACQGPLQAAGRRWVKHPLASPSFLPGPHCCHSRCAAACLPGTLVCAPARLPCQCTASRASSPARRHSAAALTTSRAAGRPLSWGGGLLHFLRRLRGCRGRRDGFLTEDELKPIFRFLHPREHDYARIQVGRTMQGRSSAEVAPPQRSRHSEAASVARCRSM